MTKRQKLGEIFVEKGLVTPTTLERALLRARRQKKKVGFVLEDIEVITGEELADALAQQYGYRVVSDFARFKFSPDALRLLSVDVALPNLLFPLKVENGRLAIAINLRREPQGASAGNWRRERVYLSWILVSSNISLRTCRRGIVELIGDDRVCCRTPHGQRCRREDQGHDQQCGQ